MLSRRPKRSPLLLLPLLLLWAACSPEPQEIHYGQDGCDRCRMMIMDARFSAELVTRTGKVYKFDAIECLAAYTLEKKVPAEAVHSLWVSPFDQPAAFIPAHTAIFLHSSSLGSPMGMSLSSYQSKSDAEVSQQRHAGDLLSWGEVVRLVASAWFSTATPAK